MDLKTLAKNKPLLWGAVALLVLVAGVIGWRAYSSYRQHSLQQAVVPQVQAALGDAAPLAHLEQLRRYLAAA